MIKPDLHITHNLPRGFAALYSSLVLSVVLLSVAVLTSESAFFTTRSHLLARDHAEARARAEACREMARYGLTRDENYLQLGTTTYLLSTHATCTVFPLERNDDSVVIFTHARSGNALSQLRSEVVLSPVSDTQSVLVRSYETRSK